MRTVRAAALELHGPSQNPRGCAAARLYSGTCCTWLCWCIWRPPRIHSAADVLLRPAALPPLMQVMLIWVSAPVSPLKRSDLACAQQLRFVVTAKEKGAAEEGKVRVPTSADLKPHD